MQTSSRLGMILAIVLLVLGATHASAQSPCCTEVDGLRCRPADNVFTLTFERAGTGCWEGDSGVCIGGSHLQNCVCVGKACFARYWGEGPRDIQPVYVPVDAESCARTAKGGCCNKNRYPAGLGNCLPPQ